MVKLRYASWKADVERTVGPWGIVLKSGRWHLVAMVGAAFRTYRIASIQGMEVLEEVFDWPPDFDLARHWELFARDYENRMQSGRAKIKIRSSALDQLSRMRTAMAGAVRTSGPR